MSTQTPPDLLLRPIDRQVGLLVGRRDPSADRRHVLERAAALASAVTQGGDSHVPLADWAGRAAPRRAEEAVAGTGGATELNVFPDRKSLVSALLASPLVGSGTVPTPLVLAPGDRLYLYRYWKAEKQIAGRLSDRLRARLPSEPVTADPAVQARFRTLFPSPPPGEPADLQALAAVSALAAPFTLISGGPGTGKTTTVARLLALLLTAMPDLRIELAAPTGKASQRLGEAIARECMRMDVPEELRERIPREARTLHRLLGYRPGDRRFTRSANRPLTADVVVIDEASMVDLLLFEALVEALPDHGRLVLLGDRHQLPSVDVGQVFSDLCHVFLNDPAQVAAAPSAVGPPPAPAVELTKTYRFSPESGIARVSAAVRAGDAAAAAEALRTDGEDATWRDLPDRAEALLAEFDDGLSAYLESRSPEEALDRLGSFRLLCAVNRGPWGVEVFNTLIEARLQASGRLDRTPWYRLRPVLVTTNDYEVDLFNGDIGVCWPHDGRSVVCFADGAGGHRTVSPGRLPEHVTAWAMTVHKSQGSEFDRVWLVLPPEPSPLLTRELVYTAVTRARRSVTVFARMDVFRAAVQTPTRRRSGLREMFS